MTGGERFYEAPAGRDARRSAPAALRNRDPIAQVLGDWLPQRGLVLEIASGTGEHAVHFARHFPMLEWQPSDVHPDALASMSAWQRTQDLPNLRPPILLDAASADWPNAQADAIVSTRTTAESSGFDVVLNLNMVHISPWSAALGLLDGAARVLKFGGALILYGPWLQAGVETAAGNVEFDRQLRQRDPEWGLRHVEHFGAAALERGFALEQTRAMPANNLMLLFRREPGIR